MQGQGHLSGQGISGDQLLLPLGGGAVDLSPSPVSETQWVSSPVPTEASLGVSVSMQGSLFLHKLWHFTNTRKVFYA